MKLICGGFISRRHSARTPEMKKNTIYFLLLMVTTSEAFFIQSRDVRRMLRFIPWIGEELQTHNPRPPLRHPNYRRFENIADALQHDDSNLDRNDRHLKDHLENRNRNHRLKNQNLPKADDYYYQRPTYTNDRKGYHPEDCTNENHDHTHRRGTYHPPEDRRYENPNKSKFDNRKKYEDREEINDDYEQNRNKQKNQYHQKKYQKPILDEDHSTATPNEDESYYDQNEEFRQHKHHKYKKDYVTGVLVTIPKTRNDDHLPNYYREPKPQNILLQSILKTDDEHYHSHHSPETDIIKSIIY